MSFIGKLFGGGGGSAAPAVAIPPPPTRESVDAAAASATSPELAQSTKRKRTALVNVADDNYNPQVLRQSLGG